jgi:FkbM family methyltransferase
VLQSFRTRLELLRDHPIARRQRLRTLARFTRAEILNRAMRRPFLFDHDFGVTLIVDQDLHSTRGHYFFGLHDFQEELFLLHFLRQQELFVDAGANLGVFSMLVARATGAQVIAFEPSPRSAAIMKRQIALNHLERQIELVEACVGNRTMQVSIRNSVEMDNAIVLAEGAGDAEMVDVPMLRIDDVVRPRSACVLKMDVEGFEKPALEGALSLLESDALRALVVETRGIGSRYGYETDDLSSLILRHGFVPARYDPWARAVSAVPVGEDETLAENANTFFVRDLEEAQNRVTSAPRRRIFGLAV